MGYIDDLLVFSESVEEPFDHVATVSRGLNNPGVKLNIKVVTVHKAPGLAIKFHKTPENCMSMSEAPTL